MSVHAIRAAHTVLSSALTRAVRWGWIPRNPAADASPPAEPRREINPPTVDDVGRALAAAGGQLAAFLMLAATTGARRGELAGLQWRDLTLEQHTAGSGTVAGSMVVRRGVTYTPSTGVVVGDTKTGRSGHRVVALDVVTVRCMAGHQLQREQQLEQLGIRWRPDWFVFSATAGETPWRPDYPSARWRKLRAELGIGEVRLHDLRHFMATSMLEDGVAPLVVAGRLGHTTTATTLGRYAHFVRAADAAAANALGDRLDPTRGDAPDTVRVSGASAVLPGH